MVTGFGSACASSHDLGPTRGTLACFGDRWLPSGYPAPRHRRTDDDKFHADSERQRAISQEKAAFKRTKWALGQVVVFPRESASESDPPVRKPTAKVRFDSLT